MSKKYKDCRLYPPTINKRADLPGTPPPRFPFWLVYNRFGFPPRMRHLTEKTALAEAKRLAQVAPGVSFYVLKTVSREFVPVEKNQVKKGLTSISR